MNKSMIALIVIAGIFVLYTILALLIDGLPLPFMMN